MNEKAKVSHMVTGNHNDAQTLPLAFGRKVVKATTFEAKPSLPPGLESASSLGQPALRKEKKKGDMSGGRMRPLQLIFNHSNNHTSAKRERKKERERERRKEKREGPNQSG